MMKILAGLLILGGILGLLIGIDINTSTGSGPFGNDMVNLALLQKQMIVIIISCCSILSGLLISISVSLNKTINDHVRDAINIYTNGHEAVADIKVRDEMMHQWKKWVTIIAIIVAICTVALIISSHSQ